ncbi:MAG TPA: pyridoxamine 5'-phosphate oxidase family protein [Mycobacteriales bacterium]|jgi:PPOX class probable F420-dependent enzyme|nr:pyridoxamine 5'-phosphate oxidase family protein [Mycobacteriales bacterium]
MDARNLNDDLPLLDWADVAARLDRGITQAPHTGGPDRHTCWLTTIDPDGAPHVTGVGAVWHEGTFWFVSGEGTRKSRNVARDPRCAVSVSTAEYDLVLHGDAERVTDRATLDRMAAVYAADGWPAEVDETGTGLTAPFNAPTAGPPPWSVYRIAPRRATALLTDDPGGATSWRF